MSRKESPAFRHGEDVKLNLGCGQTQIEGYLGVDFELGPTVSIVHDLTKHPWPFPDNSVDGAIAWHFLEHLPGYELANAMDEIHRILKPGAELYIRLPYKEKGPYNPYHFHVFDKRTFDYWLPNPFGSTACLQARHSYFTRRKQKAVFTTGRFPWWHIVRRLPWTKGILFYREKDTGGAFTWWPAQDRELREWLVKT